MFLDILVTLFWIPSIRWNSHLFRIIWCLPFLLGLKSPLINILIGFPYQIIRIHQNINHWNQAKLSYQVTILHVEIVRFFFLFLGFWNSEIYQTQTGFLWWISLQTLIEIVMDLQKFIDQDILNAKFITLILGVLVELILNQNLLRVILISIQFFLELTIQFPITNGESSDHNSRTQEFPRIN